MHKVENLLPYYALYKWCADLELNQDSTAYEAAALPLSYQRTNSYASTGMIVESLSPL